jgi:hypothetical protein
VRTTPQLITGRHDDLHVGPDSGEFGRQGRPGAIGQNNVAEQQINLPRFGMESFPHLGARTGHNDIGGPLRSGVSHSDAAVGILRNDPLPQVLVQGAGEAFTLALAQGGRPVLDLPLP